MLQLNTIPSMTTDFMRGDAYRKRGPHHQNYEMAEETEIVASLLKEHGMMSMSQLANKAQLPLKKIRYVLIQVTNNYPVYEERIGRDVYIGMLDR